MRHRSALALALVAVSGCALWPSAERSKEAIEHSAEQFGDNFQWQRWPQAAQQVHPDDRAAFLAFGSQLGDRLRITSFEIATIEVDESGDAASATVLFQLYRPPSIVEQTLVDRQQWVRERGNWFVRPALERY